MLNCPSPVPAPPHWETKVRALLAYGVYQPFNYTSFQPGIMNHPRGVYVEKSTGRVAVTDSANMENCAEELL